MASKDIMMRLRAQDKSKNAFNSVNKSLNNTQQSMNKIKGALAAAFSVGVIANFTKQTLELADTIGKVADSIGVSTDFLQKYQFAAEQSGLTQQEFNKGIQNFTKMVGQSQLRTSEAGRTLEKLGVQVKNADGSVRSAEEVFVDLFVALDNVGSQFEKVGILSDLMGRAGAKLAVLGKDGSDAMKALAESATGVIPEETIRKAEIFNDTMNELKRLVLLPLQVVVIDTANAFLDLLDAIGLVERKRTKLQLQEQLEKLQTTLSNIQDQEGQLGAQLTPLNVIGGALESMVKFGNDIRALPKGLLDSLLTEKDPVKIQTTIDQIQKTLEEMEDTDPFANFDYPSLSSNLDATNNKIKQTITVVEQFANTVEGKLTAAFQSFFDFTNKEFLNFKNLAMSVANAVINELIRVFIIEQLVSSISTSIRSIPDGINADIDKILTLDGGGYTGSGVRAGGLDGKGGFMAMLHPNETVIDHTKGQGMGSGAVVNFNISTVDAKGFDELLTSRKGMITTMINQAYNSRGKMGIM